MCLSKEIIKLYKGETQLLLYSIYDDMIYDLIQKSSIWIQNTFFYANYYTNVISTFYPHTKKEKIPTTYASSRTQDMKIKGKKCMESCKIMIDFKIVISVIV